MKRFLIIVLCLIIVLTLIACKDEQKGDLSERIETAYTSDAGEIEALAQAVIDRLRASNASEGIPTAKEVTAQYQLANIAVGWITGTERVATDSADTYEYDGLTYERVRPDCYYGVSVLEALEDNDQTNGLIYNMETLEAYLSTLIAKDEAREYIYDIEHSFDVPKFIEKENGALYALPYAYPVSGYTKEETHSLSDNGDGTYTFTVNYGIIKADGTVKEKSHDFGYEKIDGRWVFTDFVVIKQN